MEKRKPPISIGDVEMLEACRDVEGLIQALSARDDMVAKKAGEALERIGDPAVGPLIQACMSLDCDLQQKAMTILGFIRNTDAVPALVRLAYSHNADVRACACLALGPMGDQRAIGPLVYRLADQSGGVRDAAAFSLSLTEERIILPVVTRLARSNRQLLEVLETEKKAEEYGNFDPAVVARGLGTRNDLDLLQDGVVRLVSYSTGLWKKRFLRCLFSDETTRDSDMAITERCGQDIFDHLVSIACSDDDDLVRLRAIVSLGIAKNKGAISPLEHLLNDDILAIKEAATAAIKNITTMDLVDPGPGHRADKNHVTVTFQCEHCGKPVELGNKYCHSCGALLFDNVSD